MGLTHGLLKGPEIGSEFAWHVLEECGYVCFSPAGLDKFVFFLWWC